MCDNSCQQCPGLLLCTDHRSSSQYNCACSEAVKLCITWMSTVLCPHTQFWENASVCHCHAGLSLLVELNPAFDSASGPTPLQTHLDSSKLLWHVQGHLFVLHASLHFCQLHWLLPEQHMSHRWVQFGHTDHPFCLSSLMWRNVHWVTNKPHTGFVLFTKSQIILHWKRQLIPIILCCFSVAGIMLLSVAKTHQSDCQQIGFMFQPVGSTQLPQKSRSHKKLAPWSSRWFEEILVALIWLALIWLTLIWLPLIWVAFYVKIFTFFTQYSQLGNSLSTHPGGTNLTKWNFYTLFHNNIHLSTKRIA